MFTSEMTSQITMFSTEMTLSRLASSCWYCCQQQEGTTHCEKGAAVYLAVSHVRQPLLVTLPAVNVCTVYHLLTVPGHHSTDHRHNHDFLTLTNLELREMPACTSTIEDLLSWMKSVDTTWSSVTPRMPCTNHRAHAVVPRPTAQNPLVQKRLLTMITCLTRQTQNQSKQHLEDGLISDEVQKGSRDLEKAADRHKCANNLMLGWRNSDCAAGAAKHTAVLVYGMQPYAQQKKAAVRSGELVECACHVARCATALHDKGHKEGGGGGQG